MRDERNSHEDLRSRRHGRTGRPLVPQLVARGHEVVGMTRSASKQDLVRGLGARPLVLDALDPDAVAQAGASAEPEVIVHELTALSGPMSMRDARHPERFRGAIMTNRLRTEATTISWRLAAPWGLGESRRASGLSGSPARTGRCRPRRIRSIPPRRGLGSRGWRRSSKSDDRAGVRELGTSAFAIALPDTRQRERG